MKTMSRPPWTPDDEHERLMDETVEAVEAWKAAEKAMWAKFVEARARGVKINHLLDRIGDEPSRATVFRRLRDANEAE